MFTSVIAILSSPTLLYLSSCGFSWKDCHPVFPYTTCRQVDSPGMIAILSSPALKTHPVFHCSDLPSFLSLHLSVYCCRDLQSHLPLYWIDILSLSAVICHPVFPSTELLSCLCLHWFAILSFPLLNCYPVSAWSDLLSCLPLYWIAILSLPAMICRPVFPCIQNPSCKSL